ncbi:MAG: DUF547 domain-containing protein [Legionellales bacterium]|nr:DUF547 domain-containing protein [Legionellales bacterium]
MNRKILAIQYVLILCCCQIVAAPNKNLWPIWQAYNNNSKTHIDHSKWQFVLSKGIIKKDEIALVNYSLLKDKYHVILQEYLKYLSTINIVQYNKNEQLAFWVNLYNALTVNIVLENYPVDSIKDIKLSGFFSSGPWDHEVFQINGQKISLNDIEHRIIRPIWDNPNTHYVLNCASIGCPNLAAVAYTGKNIQNSLEKAAIDFVNSKRGVTITSTQKLIVSKIYSWYDIDFGNDEYEIIKHIRKYARKNLKKELEKFEEISKYKYNWDLNCFNCK